MTPKVKKIILLLKKAYDQPLVFHLLHAQLINALKHSNIVYETVDDWSKLIVFSASPNRIPNQALELKLQKVSKSIRMLDTDENKLKFMCICYYLMNRETKYINHIVLFDLVTNCMGQGDFYDGLILAVLRRVCLADIYGNETNLKLTNDALQRMIQVISNTNLSYANQIQALPCYVVANNIRPVLPQFICYDDSYLSYKYFESMLFYIKYAKEINSSDLPDHPDFATGIESMMNSEFKLFIVNQMLDIGQFVMEETALFKQIEKKYRETEEKEAFKERLIEFIYNLKT